MQMIVIYENIKTVVVFLRLHKDDCINKSRSRVI